MRGASPLMFMFDYLTQPALSSRSLGHALENLTVKFSLSLNHPQHFARRKHADEFVVILLLNLLYVQIDFILLSNGLSSRLVVVRVDMAVNTHLVKTGTLFTLHFVKEGKEA